MPRLTIWITGTYVKSLEAPFSLWKDRRTEGKEDKRIGGREDNRACGQEDMRTEGQEERRTGQQVVRRTKGQEGRTGGTIYWLTYIPIDVHVLYPAAAPWCYYSVTTHYSAIINSRIMSCNTIVTSGCINVQISPWQKCNGSTTVSKFSSYYGHCNL